MPATYTPIRYPGGKTKIYPLVKKIIDDNGFRSYAYAEAFAGGAGLAMKLLLKGDVPSVIINDLDRAVYCMWDAIVNRSEDLCTFVSDVEVTVDEWKRHRETYRKQKDVDDFELGCAAFFLNRTNVSGILDGGVIGGMEQFGNFKIDARFSKPGLLAKIRAIGKRRDDIRIFNLDAETFIVDVLTREESLFAYFDPPYVKKGPGLYRSSFDEDKHRSLAKAIQKCKFPWIATYDDDELIEKLYGKNVRETFGIGYSAYRASRGKEKLILPPNVSYSTAA